MKVKEELGPWLPSATANTRLYQPAGVRSTQLYCHFILSPAPLPLAVYPLPSPTSVKGDTSEGVKEVKGGRVNVPQAATVIGQG